MNGRGNMFSRQPHGLLCNGSEAMFTCNLVYMGSAIPLVSNVGAEAAVEPMKKIFREKRFNEKIYGIPVTISVFSSGFVVKVLKGAYTGSYIWYPMQNLHLAAGFRCDGPLGKPICADPVFKPLFSGVGKLGAKLPALLSIILRETAGKKVLTCHTFAAYSPREVDCVVKAAGRAYTNKEGWTDNISDTQYSNMKHTLNDAEASETLPDIRDHHNALVNPTISLYTLEHVTEEPDIAQPATSASPQVNQHVQQDQDNINLYLGFGSGLASPHKQIVPVVQPQPSVRRHPARPATVAGRHAAHPTQRPMIYGPNYHGPGEMNIPLRYNHPSSAAGYHSVRSSSSQASQRPQQDLSTMYKGFGTSLRIRKTKKTTPTVLHDRKSDAGTPIFSNQKLMEPMFQVPLERPQPNVYATEIPSPSPNTSEISFTNQFQYQGFGSSLKIKKVPVSLPVGQGVASPSPSLVREYTITRTSPRLVSDEVDSSPISSEFQNITITASSPESQQPLSSPDDIIRITALDSTDSSSDMPSTPVPIRNSVNTAAINAATAAAAAAARQTSVKTVPSSSLHSGPSKASLPSSTPQSVSSRKPSGPMAVDFAAVLRQLPRTTTDSDQEQAASDTVILASSATDQPPDSNRHSKFTKSGKRYVSGGKRPAEKKAFSDQNGKSGLNNPLSSSDDSS